MRSRDALPTANRLLALAISLSLSAQLELRGSHAHLVARRTFTLK